MTLAVQALPHEWRCEVADTGPGMSDTVLAQALLPFCSTKRNGTGLGLVLARETAEAHGGQVSLRNRRQGGLVVLSQPRRRAMGITRVFTNKRSQGVRLRADA